MADTPEKSEVAKKEEETLAFWKDHSIFEKTLAKKAPKGEFVFYDGPPFATGLPHSGSLLSSVSKDVIPRYKTMRGFRVRRRWGWDTHGLPIESIVEKKLGLKNKKEILAVGIEKFNETARAMVLEYVHDWKRYIERVGRFVDFDNSYKTMDNTFIESVWWGLKEIHKKGRLYEGRKVLMYCPHCETPLAKAEIAMDNTYKDVTEEAVTVKFKVKDSKKYGLPENTFLLAWTTTPWTLPGNVGLAVKEDVDYALVPSDGSPFSSRSVEGSATVAEEYVVEKGTYILSKKILLDNLRSDAGMMSLRNLFGLKGDEVNQAMLMNISDKDFLERFKIKIKTGSELVGVEYEPLYEIAKVTAHKGKKLQVLAADFVTTEEGTGIVHTAVIYGEDDYALGLKEGLPMVPLLNPNATYNDDAPEFLRGQYIKKAEPLIKEDLEKRGLLFAKAPNTHSYPHCYRCGTALIYNAVSSWFINIQEVKEKMLKENEKITWSPEHLKRGRFKHIMEGAPDWTISRNRFWASPLPIWKDKKGDVTVIGSLDELKAHTKKSGNRYFVMRHGQAESNAQGIVNSDATAQVHLTEKGKKEVHEALSKLRKTGVTRIVTSPYLRTKETADIVAKELKIPKDRVESEPRFGELQFGDFNNKSFDEFMAYRDVHMRTYDTPIPNGESYLDAKKRFGDALYALEEKYTNETILIVTHGVGFETLIAVATGANEKEATSLAFGPKAPAGAVQELSFVPLPHNRNYELDYHLPYIDRVQLVSKKGEVLTRIPEVVDCWVESGSMPFAEYHYPFENKKEFEKRSPGDFVSEYIGQTRAWFYYMHAISNELFGRLAFKNVLTTGTILAADGAKLSKSKGNYTDPYVLFDKYGADAFRYYLMSSVVMQAEDLTFRDEEVKDTHARVVNMLRNVLAFYRLFKDPNDLFVPEKSPHVLDQWILLRLGQLVREVTDAFERYDVVHAVRPIRNFVDDLSTWYVRRSRDRMKGNDETDRKAALATLRRVLGTLSKLIAPVMPFIAEEIFTEVKRSGDPESVHLADWPGVSLAEWTKEKFGAIRSKNLLDAMSRVRTLASDALQLRQKAGIKVRQPLHKLAIPDELPLELIELLKDEVNVKQVRTGASSVELDTVLTPELVREGDIREFARALADARKTQNLSPKNTVRLSIQAVGESLLAGSTLPGVSTLTFDAPADAAYAVETSAGQIRFAITLDAA